MGLPVNNLLNHHFHFFSRLSQRAVIEIPANVRSPCILPLFSVVPEPNPIQSYDGMIPPPLKHFENFLNRLEEKPSFHTVSNRSAPRLGNLAVRALEQYRPG